MRGKTSSVCTALHGLVIVTSLSMCIVLYKNTLFAWHPICMSLSYILFMSEGVISGINFRTLTGNERTDAISSHAIMQLRSFVCMCIGFGAIYRNKVLNGRPHFVSTHAKIGLLSIILSVVAPLMGIISFGKLGVLQQFPPKLRPTLKMLHRTVGMVTWYVSILTISLALYHPAVNKGAISTVWQGALLAIVVLKVLFSIVGPGRPERPSHKPAASLDVESSKAT